MIPLAPLRLTALVLGLMALLPAVAGATVLDSNFTETEYVSDSALWLATGMAWAPDGSNRLFVTRKDGEIRIIKNGQLLATPFATVRPIFTGSECGLIGIAFDPDFLSNKHLYVFVTVSDSEQQIIRYTVAGDTGTEKLTVIAGLPTQGANHDGGGVEVGPDGKLYWGIGDLGNRIGVNTDLTSLAAKIGRSNRDGTAPVDNPFVDGSGPRDFIWARGMRNPFTLTFQPATGLLWVNVVGDDHEQVFIVRRSDHAGYHLQEGNQTPPNISPVIKYRTNGSYTSTLRPVAMSGAVRANGVVTFATTTNHALLVGSKVTISNVVDPSFNENFFVTSVPGPTTFTVNQSGPAATSGSGAGGTPAATAITPNFGGCVTGGTFYDATQAPAAYQGNFFFGDYNNIGQMPGRIMRATVDPATNAITSVDLWANNLIGQVDVSVGPDGALYYIGTVTNKVFRAAYNATAQGLVVSPAHLWTAEGQSMLVNVRLATAPAANVTVSLARTSGDAGIGVSAGGTLTFTPSNWSVPQSATVAVAADGDTTDDLATIGVTSPGIATQTVTVHARDEDTPSLVVSSTALAIDEGGMGSFTVALSTSPAANVTVAVARSDGDPEIRIVTGSTLTFTSSNFATPQTVTIAADQDADTTNDRATIRITASGYAPRSVEVTARDDDDSAPLITSTPVLAAVVGAPYRYDVEASGRPTPRFSLDTNIAGMTIDPNTGIVSWTPTAPGSVTVTVRAASAALPAATQTFTIVVAADRAPTCTLTAPAEGQTVSGVGAEFYGDGRDDVGTVRAEFHVDGALAYTDVGTSGHYHFGGQHNRWDTTVLTNGPHTVKLVAIDSGGQRCEQAVTVTVANARTDGGANTVLDAAAPDTRMAALDAAAPDAGMADGPRDGAARSTDAAAQADASAPGLPDALLASGPIIAGEVGSKSGCSCQLGAPGQHGTGVPVGVAAVVAALLGLRRRRRPGRHARCTLS